ncbi:TPA: fimbrial protein, partial [Providencia stuartii]|nr:fimbrial protein [Providencia stuartii]
MKNNNILFMLILYVNGLFISQFSLADPIAKDTYFFNVNESKLNFNNQNEKEQKGIIYIKGLFVMS